MKLDSIISPLLTERTRKLELSNVYTFIIRDDATKPHLKELFEKLYGQTPVHIRVAYNHFKVKRGQKGEIRKRGRIKKAYVTLKKPITNFAKITRK